MARTFRVFVSSTFSDLKAERNALQKLVFPRLRDLAARNHCRFQAIDLRWGVSEEASLDQQAMNICLGEIARCQTVSPRPNFIVLLGDRYGWCPPPSQIPARDFERILEVLSEDEDRRLVMEWYRLDRNSVPEEWRLKARERGSIYERYEGWQPVEARLHTLLAKAAEKIGFPPEQRLPYTASATEQEIAAGALLVRDAPEHVLCFFRRIEGLPGDFVDSAFADLVNTRLEHEYPAGLDASSQNLARTILDLEPGTSAKDLADRIGKAWKNVPGGTQAEGLLSLLWQALVDFSARDFLNLDEKEWTIDKSAHENQELLKNRLTERLNARPAGSAQVNIFNYSSRWIGDGITTDHIGTLPATLEHCLPLLEDEYSPANLCEAVWCSLGRIMRNEMAAGIDHILPEQPVSHVRIEKELDAEGLAHHRFAEERLRFFVGRTEILAKITAHPNRHINRSLAIVGAGGTGKSALMARAIQQVQEAYPNAEVVYRFIGATPGSSDGRSLLESLCREISRRYNEGEEDIPTDYRDLVPELGKRFQLAAAGRPLIVFIDSLDQLSASQDAANLIWLPTELPEHVSVIVSARPEEPILRSLQHRQAILEELGGLSRQEGNDLLTQWLGSVRRTLQASQYQEVLDKFEKTEGNPLYLKLAFEEARLWASDPVQAHIPLEQGVRGIIRENMIGRLKHESNHGEALVSHALGYLAASRYGLTEDELLDLLSRDPDVYRWFMEGSHHLPDDLVQAAAGYRRDHVFQNEMQRSENSGEEEKDAVDWLARLIRSAIKYRGMLASKGEQQNSISGDEEAAGPSNEEFHSPLEQVQNFLDAVLLKTNGPRLPVVLWSRLSFDLAPYLTERMLDGSPLLNFYHRELGDVSKDTFLGEGKDQLFHERLADYFLFKADPNADRSWTGSYPHGLSELPYHLIRAEQFEEVYRTLTDFKFLEHKASEVGVQERRDEAGYPVRMYTGVLQLQDDYELALAALPGGERDHGNQAPLIITALETSKGLKAYCPVCNNYSEVKREMLDTVIGCPQESCRTPLKLNPFTVRREV